MEPALANVWNAWACILWSISFAITAFSLGGCYAIYKCWEK